LDPGEAGPASALPVVPTVEEERAGAVVELSAALMLLLERVGFKLRIDSSENRRCVLAAFINAPGFDDDVLALADDASFDGRPKDAPELAAATPDALTADAAAAARAAIGGR
jgi:hypothetical protein